MAIERICSCRKIAARNAVKTGCRYVYAATTELSACFSAQAFIRYAPTVGPAMTAANASHACDGMADHCSCIIGHAAIGSITIDATANMRAITRRAERRLIVGFERTMYSA